MAVDELLCALCSPSSSSLSAHVVSLTSYGREKLSLNSSRRNPNLRMISLSWITPGGVKSVFPCRNHMTMPCQYLAAYCQYIGATIVAYCHTVSISQDTSECVGLGMRPFHYICTGGNTVLHVSFLQRGSSGAGRRVHCINQTRLHLKRIISGTP